MNLKELLLKSDIKYNPRGQTLDKDCICKILDGCTFHFKCGDIVSKIDKFNLVTNPELFDVELYLLDIEDLKNIREMAMPQNESQKETFYKIMRLINENEAQK